jgi:3-deoxy-D-manno-octulosonic-acid transferase
MLYDIGFLIFSILYLPALIFKGKLHAGFGERFGRFSGEKRAALAAAKDAIWIEAVSVGEVTLCKSLIPALKQAFPSSDIVLSTVTRAGNELAGKLFSKDAVIIYFPLDLSWITDAVSGLVRPRVYIMMETEIWPNALRSVRRCGARTVLVNGRISDRSYGRYLMARPVMRGALAMIDGFCMQSEIDAGRIVAMGAAKERVGVTGTMKFDAPAAAVPEGGIGTILGLDAQNELLVAGSTHPGEEEIILSEYGRLSAAYPNLRLLIAPRHVERAGEVEKIVRRHGLNPVRFSALSAQRPARYAQRNTVFILDTIGRLNEIYSRASMVFVGGSLVRHGGQNPLEPAACGKAVLFGPHMFNFRPIVEILLKSDAAVSVADGRDLGGKVRMLLEDRNRMRDLGWNAKRALAANRGATMRNIEAIRRLLS